MRYKITVVTTHQKMDFFSDDQAAKTLYDNLVNSMINEKTISFKTDANTEGVLKGSEIILVIKEPE